MMPRSVGCLHARIETDGVCDECSLPLCVLMFMVIEKERMPKIDQNETVVNIEWNEDLHVDENNRRVNAILAMTDSLVEEHTAYVGMQDYLLGTENEFSSGEAELYFRTAEPSGIPVLTEMLGSGIAGNIRQQR